MTTDVEATCGRVVIAGGSGFLGLNLARHLSALGCEITILSRNSPIAGPWKHVAWDARTLGNWAEVISGARGIVNLVGRTVDCIKSPEHCDEILRSRVEATRVLGIAVAAAKNPPPVWVQMSTAHAYGDPPTTVCDEDSAFGYGLAPTVAKAWEAEFAAVNMPRTRRVVLRTSFVLGKSGGPLKTLARLARFGLGGTVGSGMQGMSWLHELDMNRLFERGIFDESMQGAYVATSPNPVSNAEFMRELRHAVGMPLGLPAPAPLVRIGARLILRTDPELALYGRYVVSRRLRDENFEFKFPELKNALRNLLSR